MESEGRCRRRRKWSAGSCRGFVRCLAGVAGAGQAARMPSTLGLQPQVLRGVAVRHLLLLTCWLGCSAEKVSYPMSTVFPLLRSDSRR